MMQEDSNGESSFEIVDNRGNEKSESSGTLSAVSSAYSMTSPSTLSMPGSNILSNVPPPSALPDLSLWSGTTPNNETQENIAPVVTTIPNPQDDSQNVVSQLASMNININPIAAHITEQFPTTQFSAAIPPSKGVQHGPVAQQPRPAELAEGSGGFMGMVKEAFSSGGVLSKMAEKAKNSVDSIITTLDPQMSEYIHSAGDTEVTVTSDNEEEVGAIRDAFHSVFGKAWVNGIKLNLPPKPAEAIGFEEGFKNAQEKLNYSLKFRNTPTVAIENIILEQNNRYFDLSILVLRDVDRDIIVETFTQATPIPVSQFVKNIENEKPDCKSLSTAEKLAIYLQDIPEWQFEISGIPRKEVLLLAAKALVKVYKNKLISK
ncbi:unnamed protein product [Callosobruchus maculatus]|uniref:Non-canonical purine NTP phosphatase/PRRC1 domain-containing protein n=1 Tax=Callosobruchus maculatus TaxID=64391 RepID=A0A653DVB4_CALMS|nr:unnamed protein product [Callosobruchus maculatus]